MTRIANYASQQILNTYLQKVQQRLNNTQIQVTSEKRAQDYMGIGYDTQRLVGYEINIGTLNGYQRNNNIEDVYLQTSDTTITSIETTIKDFRKTLTSFNTQAVKDQNSIRTIQEQAFRSLQSLQSYLNTEVNGRSLFGGNRVDTAPVDLGLTTLADFQEKYDGISVKYPETRAQHMENFDLSADVNGKTNWLTFTQDSDGNTTTAGTSTITATTAQFANVTVGSTIEVTGTASNNGTYEVSGVTGGGTTIQIKTVMLTDEALVAGATLTGTDGTALTSTNFGTATFNRAAGSVTAATAGSLSALTVGSSFTVTGSAQNNGTYNIISNDGTTIKIKQTKLTNEGTGASTVQSLTAQNFTFTTGPSTINSGVPGTYSALAPGMKITIGGTVSNNTTYTVDTVVGGGQSITVKEVVTAEVYAGGAGTALVTQATPTLDLVAQSFTFTDNVSSFDTIDSGVAGSFSALKAGMKITFGNTVSNNSTFTIDTVSSDGKSITVREAVTTESPTLSNDTAVVTQADGTVKSVNYYQGDSFTRTHRPSENREFTIDLNAADPAFEKAIRAMSIIMQGKFGTAGGLEQTANAHRLTDAVNLMDLALKSNTTTNPQYEAGFTSNIEQSLINLGYQRSLIKDANTMHTRMVGFFEQRTAQLENIDKLDAITRLLDDQKSLEASYQAMAAIRGLSLHNYLS